MSKQLAYSGLIEVAKVRAAGYAHRRTLLAFSGFYKVCVTDREAFKAEASAHGRARRVVEELGVAASAYQLGRTLIFLTDDALEVCERARLSAAAPDHS
eukprot:3364063-Prymnesium_polylepis.1